MRIIFKLFRKVFVFIILIEIFLQFMAAVNSIRFDINSKNVANKKSELTILCLGDSFTYGIGSGISLSYPAQLEKIIESSFPALKTKVVNCGIPGSNSSTLANNFSKYLDEFKPDIILVCIGRNDDWNLENVDFSLLSTSTNFSQKLLVNKLDSILIHIRIYKLARYWFSLKNIKQFQVKHGSLDDKVSADPNAVINGPSNLDSEVNKAEELINEKKYSSAVAVLEVIRDKVLKTNDVFLVSKLGFLYYKLGESSKALEIFDHFLRYDPASVEIYRLRGEVYFQLGKNDLAFKDFEKALKLAPYNYPPKGDIYRRMGIIYLNQGDKLMGVGNLKKAFLYDHDLSTSIGYLNPYFTKNEIINLINYFTASDKNNPQAKVYLRFLKQDKYGDFRKRIDCIIKNNLNKMFQESRRRGIKMYYINYPSNGYPPDGVAEPFVNTFWHGCLIDIKGIFTPLFEGKEKSEYFIPDNHCTEKGYGIMAKIVFSFLEKDILFFSKKSRLWIKN